MKTIFISLLVVVVCMITSTALRGQNKPPGKFWQKLGENDSLVIESLSSLNSSRNDYSPIFLDGVLYFTSSRKDRYTDESTLQYNESIYTSYYQDSVWSQPKKHYFFNTDDLFILLIIKIVFGLNLKNIIFLILMIILLWLVFVLIDQKFLPIKHLAMVTCIVLCRMKKVNGLDLNE